MQKLLKNKLVMYAVCAFIAAAVVVALFALTTSNGDDTTTVIRLKSGVGVNKEITADMVAEKTVGAYGLSDKVIKDKAEVVGKYTKVAISPDDNLTADKLSNSFGDVISGTVKVNTDQRLMTISAINAAAGGGGYLKSGSVVDVIGYKASNDEKAIEAIADIALENITVYCVKNTNLVDVSEKTDAEALPAFVTLVVTPEQAKTLAKMEYSQKLHLLLVK